MKNLASIARYCLPYGFGKLLRFNYMKNVFFFIISILLIFLSCTQQKSQDVSNISIYCHLKNNNNELVYCVTNNYKNDAFFLDLLSEIKPEIFIKKANDSIWRDATRLFYLYLLEPRDRPLEIIELQKKEYAFKPEIYKKETSDFFYMVLDRIKSSKLSLKEDELMMFDQNMCSSVFLKMGESFSDTISLHAIKKKYPEYDLKFVFVYPSTFLYDSERSYLDYYVNSFLDDSLGIKVPETLDGYKFVYESSLKYEFIVRADR